MVTEQEEEVSKQAAQPWDSLVQIQFAKSPDVVKRTVELLAEVGRNEEGKCLKGQWVYSESWTSARLIKAVTSLFWLPTFTPEWSAILKCTLRPC